MKIEIHLQKRKPYLMSKLIAGHTQDNESLGGEARVKLVHLRVVPDCCSSEGRYILNENNFPLQCGETEGFTGQQLCCQVVEPLNIPSHFFATS